MEFLTLPPQQHNPQAAGPTQQHRRSRHISNGGTQPSERDRYYTPQKSLFTYDFGYYFSCRLIRNVCAPPPCPTHRPLIFIPTEPNTTESENSHSRMNYPFCLVLLIVYFTVLGKGDEALFSNSWAVEVTGGPEEADRLARKHGFSNRGQVWS